MPSSCSSSTEETVSFMICSKETLGASCGSGVSCGSSAGSSSGAFSSEDASVAVVSAAGFPSSSDTGWCGKWMICVSGGWSSSGSSGPPEENTSSSTSAGKSISTGSAPGGSFLLSRGFCRSSLRGVFLRRQILRPVQVAAAAELRQNILQGKLRYFVVILSVFHGTSLLDAPGPYTVRWRTASYSSTAAAAEAFRELILPNMGMDTVKSQFSATSRLMPSPSEPMTMAAGPLRSAS